MSLKPFTYPFPETRFLHAGPNVYKFKIRYGNNIRGEEIENKEVIFQELEALPERKEVDARRRKRKHMETPNSTSRRGLGRAKMGTSSHSPSRKKPLMETKRNRERKTQQAWQGTPALDVPVSQEQDSKWEDSLAAQVSPRLQHNRPPPPQGPAGPSTGGFFGFLSSLFPFRYFFRKSSQ
ncbi:membrane-anchored junction protein [Sorex araneus]|uniref:membrane-anchored junction protein n=1 Tax=Sorex araneus TaxID=42254 RepID=UPI00064AE4D8|nr:membrane-anchored junction protein [Sorex araneus]